MFTGIVQDVGRIIALEPRGGDVRLRVAVSRMSLADTHPGDSIAVSGVCLTALEITADSFAADVSNETLSLTTLGALTEGSRVNLEPALRAGDALGGHLVSGHVDGVGTVLDIASDARSVRMRFGCPAPLARYFARKGSVAIDGVSLTINEAGPADFSVNLEVDQVARYVERLLEVQR